MIVEFNKLTKNKFFYISFFTLLLIVVIGAWRGIDDYNREFDLTTRLYGEFPDTIGVISPFLYWVGNSSGISSAFFTSFYYFITPLVVSLPIVDSLHSERTSGFISYQVIRMERLKYYWNRFLFTYCVSFFLFSTPLAIGVIVINTWTGIWDYSSYSESYHKIVEGTFQPANSPFISYKKELFSQLVVTSPYLYFLVYLTINSMYMALYVCFGLAVSFYLKNRYVILFVPMCLQLGTWILFTILGLLSWDPFNFKDPRQPVTDLTYWPFLIDYLLLLLIVTTLYIQGARKLRDVFE